MEVSVVIVVYNEESYIKNCLQGVLEQSFSDFEVVIIDDSSDQTGSVVKSVQDKRIRYIKSGTSYSVAEARNIGIKEAKGEYIFFTDADCVPTRYWLEEGLRVLKEKKCVGAEGMTFYATAKTTISDRIIEKISNGCYGSTDNLVYKREFLDKAGGFDEGFKDFEDQDLGRRIKKYGDILFASNMLVIHQRKKYSIKKLLRDTQRAASAVKFVKKYRDYRNFDIVWRRVMFPKKLLILLFPFLLFFYHGFRNWQDIKLIPFIYFNAIYTRCIVWKIAFQEKIFLV